MQIITNTLDTYTYHKLADILHSYNNTAAVSDFLFFDIETTGFSARNSLCYLIGCVSLNNENFIIKQFFADNPSDCDDEKKMLTEFMHFASGFKYIVHFNGDVFDIPYLKERMYINGLPEHQFPESIDLFKKSKSLRLLFKLENYKQKTIEHFLGINRSDKSDGGELITVYKQYLTGKTLGKNVTSEYNMLLLHNHDDVCNLPFICHVLSYNQIWNEETYKSTSFSITNGYAFNNNPVKEITFSITLPCCVPKDVSYGNDLFYIKLSKNLLKLRTKIHECELKYFYTDYKNYYYLPDEDYAIHKSISSFVDKSRRIPAKASTCYSKKKGSFIAQPSDIIAPSFKYDYKDNISYFEASDSFFNSPQKIDNYVYKTITSLL